MGTLVKKKGLDRARGRGAFEMNPRPTAVSQCLSDVLSDRCSRAFRRTGDRNALFFEAFEAFGAFDAFEAMDAFGVARPQSFRAS